MKYGTLTAKTEEEILKKIADYLQLYPVQGYGTRVSPHYFNAKANLWTANTEREESCD